MKGKKIQIYCLAVTAILVGLASAASASMIEFAFTGHLSSWSGDPSQIGNELNMSLRVDNHDNRITFRGLWNHESLWSPDIHQPYNQFASWDVTYSFSDTFAGLGWQHSGATGAMAIENSPHGAHFESMFTGLSYILEDKHYSLTQDGYRYGLSITEYFPNGTYGQSNHGLYEWDSVIIRDVAPNLPIPEPATAALFLLGTGLTVLNKRLTDRRVASTNITVSTK